MIIKSVSISNLRNHNISNFEVQSGLNIFYGNNGAGKTTVLEAISLCALSRTFQPTSDSQLIKKNTDSYAVELHCESSLGIPYFSKVSYSQILKKKISNSESDNLSAKDIIGTIPIIILSPDLKTISFGSPQDRRQFLDTVLSQASRVYFEDLIKFRKILKQRNNLLINGKLHGNLDKSLFEIWTTSFIEISVDIISRRNIFFKEFEIYFKSYYEKISQNREDVGLRYIPNNIEAELLENNNLENFNKEIILKSLYEKAVCLYDDEIRRAMTLFGPQKDELQIIINGGSARDFASQGQHKTLLISFKFAEFQFLKNKKNEIPIVLLDDIFSELDNQRLSKVIDIIRENSCQTFITMTEPKILDNIIDSKDRAYFFEVFDGNIRKI